MALPYIVTNDLVVRDNTSNPITFFNDNGNTISLSSPTGLSTTYTMTLPVDEGVNASILTTDGVNQTSWTDENGTRVFTSFSNTDTFTSATFTTSSTTPVVMTGMTQTLTSGVYNVYFSGTCVPDNTIIEYAIYNNGVLESTTSRELEVVSAGVTDRFIIATHGVITIPSTQDIDVRVNVTNIAASIDILDRSLSTLKIQD